MIAEQLTDKEISELAAYYASLPGKDAAKPVKK
jgi:cytochrome c553